MLIQKLRENRYHAKTTINGYSVKTNDLEIPVELEAYGDTHLDAIIKCLNKVKQWTEQKQ